MVKVLGYHHWSLKSNVVSRYYIYMDCYDKNLTLFPFLATLLGSIPYNILPMLWRWERTYTTQVTIEQNRFLFFVFESIPPSVADLRLPLRAIERKDRAQIPGFCFSIMLVKPVIWYFYSLLLKNLCFYFWIERLSSLSRVNTHNTFCSWIDTTLPRVHKIDHFRIQTPTIHCWQKRTWIIPEFDIVFIGVFLEQG